MAQTLTRDGIQALDAQYSATATVVDASVPDTGPGCVTGLAVRIQRTRPGGTLTLRWVCRRRVRGGTPVRVVLGDALVMRRADARTDAHAAMRSLSKGENPNEAQRLAAQERAARKAAACDWLDVLRAYANPPHPHQRPATLYARGLVLRWFEHAVQQRRNGSAPPGVAALAAIAQADIRTLANPLAAAPLFAPLAPLLAAPEQAAAGARPSAHHWGPLRSRSSLLKLVRVCTGAWNADGTLPRPVNPWAAWRHASSSRLRPPPPRERQLLFPLTVEDAHAERDGPAGRWLRALVDERAASQGVAAAQADWLLCCVLWGTRATECALLTWADLTLDARPPFAAFRATKVGRTGYRPLLPLARAILLARQPRHPDPGDWIFPGAQSPIHARSVSRADLPRDAEHWHAATPTALLDRIVRRADPAAARQHDRLVERGEASPYAHTASALWISPHDLRRTLAGFLMGQSGLPEQAAALILDHVSPGTTALYQRAREQRLRAQQRAYDRWEAVLAVLAPELAAIAGG